MRIKLISQENDSVFPELVTILFTEHIIFTLETNCAHQLFNGLFNVTEKYNTEQVILTPSCIQNDCYELQMDCVVRTSVKYLMLYKQRRLFLRKTNSI